MSSAEPLPAVDAHEATVVRAIEEVADVLTQRIDSITLTSFGPFLDVVLNPSQEVADHVQDMLKSFFSLSSSSKQPSSSPNFDVKKQIVHDKGLEVSITRVSRYFSEKREELLLKASSNDGDDKIDFLIHFGVHNGSRAVKVELTGVNCVGWRGTDFEGFTCPIPRPITPFAAAPLDEGERKFYPDDMCSAWEPYIEFDDVKEDGALSSALSANGTDLSKFGCVHVDYTPVSAVHFVVAAANREVLGDGVDDPNNVRLAVSHSAGRYLCNFTLYSSLALTSELNAKRRLRTKENNDSGQRKYMSLFIHVVATEDMQAIDQARLITAFLIRWMALCTDSSATA